MTTDFRSCWNSQSHIFLFITRIDDNEIDIWIEHLRVGIRVGLKIFDYLTLVCEKSIAQRH